MQNFRFNKKTDSLFEAILSLNSVKEAEAFFRDLCTVEEIEDMTDRWQIVKLINKGKPYRKIAQRLKTSTTTVARVASWLRGGKGGYRLVLDRQKSHHHNSSSTGKGV